MSSHHGNTPAAWTAVSVALVGFVVAGVGLMLSPISMVLFWIGMALLPVALVLWGAMERMGMGAERH